MNFLLTLWPAIPALALAWLIHNADVDRIEARQAKALTEQATALQEQCAADKKLTQGAENAYQKQIADLYLAINALKLRKPARCVPVYVTVPAKRPHATAPSSKLPDRDGIESSYLIDYAGRAEQCRLKLMGLQGFVSEVWRKNGQ